MSQQNPASREEHNIAPRGPTPWTTVASSHDAPKFSVVVEDVGPDGLDSPRTPVQEPWQVASGRVSPPERRASRKQSRAAAPPSDVRAKELEDAARRQADAEVKRIAKESKKLELAALKEAERRAAFIASRDRVYESPAPPGRPATPVDFEVVSPADSLPARAKRHLSERSRKPRKERKKHEQNAQSRNHPAPMKVVTKIEAATPVARSSDSDSSPLISSEEEETPVVFSTYEFKKLNFVGFWNNSIVADNFNHAEHFWGVHVDHGDTMTVQIYPGLVETLAAYLSTRTHDAKFANYTVAQAKCLALCRDPKWIMTPQQRLTSVLYAPAIAYMLYWKDVQHISRVVTQCHFDFSWWLWIGLHAAGLSPLAHTYASHSPAPSSGFDGPIKVYKGLPRSSLFGLASKFYAATKDLPRYCKMVKSKFTGGSTTTFNTENADVAPKPQRPDSGCKLRNPSPFVKPDLPSAVKPSVEQVGPADHDFRPRAFENNVANTQTAIDARVLAATPEPCPATLKDYVKFVKQNADELFGKACRIEPISFDVYIKNSNASPSVKAQLIATHARLESEGIDCHSDVSKFAHEWTTRRAFTKKEFTNHRSPFGVTEKAPRLIQGATPEFICLVGPWFAAFQGYLKKQWNAKASITFASGVDAGDLANNLKVEGRTIFDDDVSAFDASFVEELLRLEVWHAKRYCAPRATLQLLDANCLVHGTTPFGHLYHRKGCRCSGDPGTSCNNSWQNGCMHCYIYARSRNISCKEALRELKMLVAGDDNLGSHPTGVQVDWASGMAKLGFKATPHYPKHPYLAEFCSMRLTPVEGGYTLVPKVGRVINKIAWCLDRPSSVSKKALVRGTALSLWKQSEPCPPLRAYLANLLRLTEGTTASKPKDEPWKTSGGGGVPTAETWCQLSEVYNWSPEMQESWERYLNTTTLETNMKHAGLTMLLMADTDGPQDDAGSAALNDTLHHDTTTRPHLSAQAEESAANTINGSSGFSGSESYPYDWATSREDRNREAHAKNGNRSVDNYTPPMSWAEQVEQRRLWLLGYEAKHAVREYNEAFKSSALYRSAISYRDRMCGMPDHNPPLERSSNMPPWQARRLLQSSPHYRPVPYSWYLSGDDLNRLAHATNGNIDSLASSMPVDAETNQMLVNSLVHADSMVTNSYASLYVALHGFARACYYRTALVSDSLRPLADTCNFAALIPEESERDSVEEFIHGHILPYVGELPAPYDWSLSNEDRNQAAHSTNGNIMTDDYSKFLKQTCMRDYSTLSDWAKAECDLYAAPEPVKTSLLDVTPRQAFNAAALTCSSSISGLKSIALKTHSAAKPLAYQGFKLAESAGSSVVAGAKHLATAVADTKATLETTSPAVFNEDNYWYASLLLTLVVSAHFSPLYWSSLGYPKLAANAQVGKWKLMSFGAGYFGSQIAINTFLRSEYYANVVDFYTTSAACPAYSWSLSGAAKNKLQHALNGNSSSVSRSEKILNALSEALHITPEGEAYLITAMDLFHDNPIENYRGIPDSVTGDSVNPVLKFSKTVSCPPGITTGTWDAHVVMLPFDAVDAQPLSFSTSYTFGRSNLVDANVGGVPYRRTEPITILTYPTGDNTGYAMPFRAGVPSTTERESHYLELNSVMALGNYRVVSQGFEVINSTAPINAQGMCTVYRSPVPALVNNSTVSYVWDEPGGTIKADGAVSQLSIDRLPQGTEEALLLRGTKQWHAKEGCYIMGRINNCDSFPINSSYVQPIIKRNMGAGVAPSDEELWMPVPELRSYAEGKYKPMFRQIQWANMDISGAYFTGLSLGTTLTITWQIAIERFPSVLEPDILALASPSPDYCPQVFELYKALTQHMPVGCMQKENGLGDWFRDAVATVAEVVSPVIAMVPHPAAQAISAGAAGLGKLAKRNEEEKQAIEAVVAKVENNNSPFTTTQETAEINRAASKALQKLDIAPKSVAVPKKATSNLPGRNMNKQKVKAKKNTKRG